jgi:glycosyltransferase involved in cell wall biosynthesis
MPERERPISVGVDLRALVGTPTGIGFYTLALLGELAVGDRLRLVGMAHREPEHADELRAAGVEIEVRGALSGVVWQQTVVPRRLRRGDLDVFWSPILTLPLDLPVPGVTTVHDLTPLLHPELHRLKVRWSVRPFLARNLAAATAIVADSESTAADLRRYFPDCADRLEVIYPGVDRAFRPASPESVARVRSELDCPDGYLLYAGTLEPRKNLELLLDAWQRAREANPALPPLILTGPRGWAEASLFRRLEALRGAGVRWLGRQPRERLVEIMQAARWFVYPSLYEGFGLGVAEAMACGVPPIAARASSLPEIVGDAGFLVDPHDASELAALLARLTDEDGAAIGRRARSRAERFDWAIAAERLAATLGRAARPSV